MGHVWDGVCVREAVSLERRHLKGGHGVRCRSVRTRTVPLGAAVRERLGDYLAYRRGRCAGNLDPRAALFVSGRGGRGLTRWRINALVQMAAAQAGLPGGGRYGSHSLRKSFCRQVYAASGRDINLTRAAMGHCDIGTTQRYLSISDDDVRAVILAIPA